MLKNKGIKTVLTVAANLTLQYEKYEICHLIY